MRLELELSEVLFRECGHGGDGRFAFELGAELRVPIQMVPLLR
jgi:hypothetical protein